MSKVPWPILNNSYPRAHLVAGAMPTGQPLNDSDLYKAYAGLERLVKKFETAGTYAMLIVRNVNSSGVHLAFELEGEAQRFAAAVNAEVTEGYPGWATQQSFQLSDVMSALVPSLTRPVTKRPPWNRLKHDIDLLAQTIQSNALTLKSKTMNDDDREALQRQMTIRVAHQKLLQKRLDRLQASGG
jgi:hypothetical protein